MIAITVRSPQSGRGKKQSLFYARSLEDCFRCQLVQFPVPWNLNGAAARFFVDGMVSIITFKLKASLRQQFY